MTANLQAWQDVPIFLAVYRHRTLAAAAARLGLDTSTASRRIAALEAALDTRLFDRTREGLTPTRAAEQVLAAAEAMEAAHARLTRDASEVEAAAEGIVRISAAPGVTSVFVAPELAKLRAAHPRISIELDASVAPRDLTRYEADLALRSVKLAGAELIATKLATTPWVAACAPGAVKRLTRWDALPWITWDRDFSSFHVSRWLAQHVPRAEIALRTSDYPSQLAAAAGGLGIVMAPLAYLERSKLVAVPIAPALRADAAMWPTDDLWLVGHRALRDVPRVAAVWTFLAGIFRG